MFDKGLETIKGFTAEIMLQDAWGEAVFYKTRPVPRVLRLKVEEELAHLESLEAVKVE